LHRRLPRRGFKNLFKKMYAIVNLEDIAANKFLAGVKEIDPAALAKAGLIRSADLSVKILGDGNLKGAVTLKAHKFSQSTLEKIKSAGGSAVVIEG